MVSFVCAGMANTVSIAEAGADVRATLDATAGRVESSCSAARRVVSVDGLLSSLLCRDRQEEADALRGVRVGTKAAAPLFAVHDVSSSDRCRSVFICNFSLNVLLVLFVRDLWCFDAGSVLRWLWL